jgi:hypothetical protein
VSLEGGAYLIGWSDEDVPLSAEVVDWPYSTIETALYVYALPVAELEDSAGAVIPSSLIRREIVDTVGYVDEFPEGFQMGPESEATFRFTLWSGITLGQVKGLVLDMQPGYASAPAPVVSAWDLESEDWHRLDVGWGQHSISNAERYVSPSGSVLLHLEATGEVTVERLALTIKG